LKRTPSRIGTRTPSATETVCCSAEYLPGSGFWANSAGVDASRRHAASMSRRVKNGAAEIMVESRASLPGQDPQIGRAGGAAGIGFADERAVVGSKRGSRQQFEERICLVAARVGNLALPLFREHFFEQPQNRTVVLPFVNDVAAEDDGELPVDRL